MRTAFGLSAAEAEVALTLAKGVPLTQIAAARGATVTTVQNQLKSVFAKARVNSQAALVRLVLRAAGGL